MPDGRWVNAPDRAPHACPFTFQSDPADGPYFEARFNYFGVVDDGGQLFPDRQPKQLYLSPQAIREICEVQGSPLVAVPREQHAGDQQELERLRAELDAAEDRVSELESEVSLLREYSGAPVDVHALAEALIVPLGQHFSRKPGPKPKAAA